MTPLPYRLLSCLTILVMLASGTGAAAQPAAPSASPQPALSELQRTKGELLKHKVELLNARKRVVELELQDAAAQLQREVAAFEADALQTLKAKPGESLDWTSWVAKPAESKKTEPANGSSGH